MRPIRPFIYDLANTVGWSYNFTKQIFKTQRIITAHTSLLQGFSSTYVVFCTTVPLFIEPKGGGKASCVLF